MHGKLSRERANFKLKRNETKDTQRLKRKKRK